MEIADTSISNAETDIAGNEVAGNVLKLMILAPQVPELRRFGAFSPFVFAYL